MSCLPNVKDPFFCPTTDNWFDLFASLLPRGRAWGGDDGIAGLPVLGGFWRAVANAFALVDERACALLDEFFCASMSETSDLWMADYALPDACDPFPDICAKVAALGGTRCDYFADVAISAGWSIACATNAGDCGARAGKSLAGKARAGRRLRSTLVIVVDLANSPAVVPQTVSNRAGRMLAGQRLNCGTSIVGLECLLARIVPAHTAILYSTI